MMPVCLSEGRLKFHFPDNANVGRYDDWSFYRNQFNKCCEGTKAIDFVFVEDGVTWLIEVKDYRTQRRTKAINLASEVAIKVRDTLAGLAAAQCNANKMEEKQQARKALRSNPYSGCLTSGTARKTF